MKALSVLSFIVATFIACNGVPPNQQSVSINESPNTFTSFTACNEKEYKHKPEAELAAVNSQQLIDEEIKEQLFHKFANWNDKNHDSEYTNRLGKYLDKIDVRSVLPILAAYIDAYDPKNSTKCDETRFFVAYATAASMDEGTIRLRGITEGKALIESLNRAIQRMKDAGFDQKDNPRKNDFDFALLHLEGLEGISTRDEEIRNTLRDKNNIQMSDSEFAGFTDFLISIDPTYPTWSEIAPGGPPFLVKDSTKYLDAYRQFKKRKP